MFVDITYQYEELLSDLQEERATLREQLNERLKKVERQQKDADIILAHVFRILGEAAPDTGAISAAKTSSSQNDELVVALEKYSYIDTLLNVLLDEEEFPDDFLAVTDKLDMLYINDRDTIRYRHWNLVMAVACSEYALKNFEDPSYTLRAEDYFYQLMQTAGQDEKFYNICKEQCAEIFYEFFKWYARRRDKHQAKMCYRTAYKNWQEYQEYEGTDYPIYRGFDPEDAFQLDYNLREPHTIKTLDDVRKVLRLLESAAYGSGSHYTAHMRHAADSLLDNLICMCIEQKLDISLYERCVRNVAYRLHLDDDVLWAWYCESMAAQTADMPTYSQLCTEYLEQQKHLPNMPEGFQYIAPDEYITELYNYLLATCERKQTVWKEESVDKGLDEYVKMYVADYEDGLQQIREKHIRNTFREKYKSEMTRFCKEWETYDDPIATPKSDSEIAPILEYALSWPVRSRVEDECVENLYCNGPTFEQMASVKTEAEVEIMHKMAQVRKKNAKILKGAKNVNGLSFGNQTFDKFRNKKG